MVSLLAESGGFWGLVAQGLGRLHLVLLHFPLGLLIAAAVLEVWARLQGRGASASAAVCLKLGAAGAVVAMGTGWLYAAGESEREVVELHRWLGTAAAGLAVVAVVLLGRVRIGDALAKRGAYTAALIGSAVLTGMAGHFGGEAVHGAGYTTEPWLKMVGAGPGEPVPVPSGVGGVGGIGDGPGSDGAALFAAAWGVLDQHCVSCHGPSKRKGGLRVDSREALLKGGKGGPSIVVGAGGAEKSYLIERVHGFGESERMPPEDEGPGLTQKEIDVLSAWIEAGAPWPAGRTAVEGKEVAHWAFVTPTLPVVPGGNAGGWGRNEIDAFVVAKLREKGLKESARAEAGVLLRRLSLDLTGLPPTVEELEAFLHDSSEGAYERAVERLLASPAYGERWARPWLDLARYGDSRGYEKDQTWVMWPYRDWVIEALNADMPFDRFATAQIAGDLLKESGEADKVATAFLRLSMLNEEGGVDPEEARVAAVVDRVETVAASFLGATVGCARCHDHKFDPVSQREFFGMYAYFNSSAEETKQVGDGETHIIAPSIRLAGRPGAEVQVMQELETPRVTRVHVRGSFLDPGEVVEAGVPAAITGGAGVPRRADRLGFAQWLVDGANPLTARVVVNRAWSTFFRRGLVETEEDFGTRGSPPSHPELLDWLAVSFVKSGWSQKWLHRQIVMSETYRQSSVMDAERMERDPENVWLWRGARTRLEAEAVRDQALALGGKLSARFGGPSVKPPQPEGVWGHAYSSERWKESEGEDRYRRGVYTFIKRATPYPSMAAFDGPSRQVTCVRRTKSNTPLAALVTLNDPVFVEAGVGLGSRMLGVRGDDDARLRWGFLACTGRSVTEEELAVLLRVLAEARERFDPANPGVARRFVEVVPGAARDRQAEAELTELAAWGVVGGVLLNLDEVLCKG